MEYKVKPWMVWLPSTISIIITIVCLSIIWKHLGVSPVTNITENNYKNQSQWQATVILPNGSMSIDIEYFIYKYPTTKFTFDESGINSSINKQMEYLKGRCLWWLETKTVDVNQSIITCFKQKVK